MSSHTVISMDETNLSGASSNPSSRSGTPLPQRKHTYPPANQRLNVADPSNSIHRTNTLTSQHTLNTLNAINSLQNPHGNDPNATIEAWMRIKDYNLRVDGLPSLDQVLAQKTQSPLSQYNLYTYLRTRHKAEDNLNFWLDVEEHEKMWQKYEIAEAERREKGRLELTRKESDREKKKRDRMSQLLGPAFETYYGADSSSEKNPSDLTPPPPVVTASPLHGGPITEADREAAYEAEMRYIDSASSIPPSSATSDEPMLLNHRGNLPEKSTSALKVLTKDPSTLSQLDLLRNAERIYRKYCSPFDPTRRIQLPEDHCLALHELIEIHKQPHPLVFQSSKNYVHEIIDQHYYPKFLNAATKTNLTPVHSRLALFLGVLALTAGFSLELSFIFLGSSSYQQRCWGFLPIFFGWMLLVTAVERFLVVLVVLRLSETTFFRFHRIKERAIQHRHNRKAIKLTALIIAITVISTVLFILLPTHTLP